MPAGRSPIDTVTTPGAVRANCSGSGRPVGAAVQVEAGDGVDHRADVADVVQPFDAARRRGQLGDGGAIRADVGIVNGRVPRSRRCTAAPTSSAAASSADGSTAPPPACSASVLSTPRPPAAAARIIPAVTRRRPATP